jgi:hypothetical protein
MSIEGVLTEPRLDIAGIPFGSPESRNMKRKLDANSPMLCPP